MKSKVKKYEILKKEFKKWNKKYNLPDCNISRDNRYDGHLISILENDGSIGIRYNTRKLAAWTYSMIVGGILHEIGHILDDPLWNKPYKTFNQKVETEYLAEKFAVKEMKKHCPGHLQKATKYMKKKLS